MKKTFVLVFRTLFALLLLPFIDGEDIPIPVDSTTLDRMTEDLNRRFSLDLNREPEENGATRRFSLTWEPVSDPDFALRRAILFTLTQELPRYPEGFVERCRLRNLYPVKNLKQMDCAMGGITLTGGRSGADIFLNLEAPKGRDGSNRVPFSRLRGNLHHELFHAVEAALWTEGDREEWDRLSPVGDASASMIPNRNLTEGRNILSPDSRKPGYINLYASSSPKEDRAVTWEWLVHPAYRRLLHGIMEKDNVVAGKVRLLTNRMAALDPAFGTPGFYDSITNENAYEDIRKMTVP